MPFLNRMRRKSNKLTVHSLRAYLDAGKGVHVILSCCRSLKRVSFVIFRKRRLCRAEGSMTLEAAFGLPLFLFAVINILFVVNMIGAQSRISAALHQTGNKMAFAGYVYERAVGNALPDGLAGVAMTHVYARNAVLEYVGRDYLKTSCVVGGAAGISFAGSSVMETGDMIDLRVSYKVKPFSGIMGFSGFTLSQRYYGRAWTGYDVTQYVSDMEQNDPMVFITETGTVYHLDRGCIYLNPSVESVPALTVKERRNRSGGRYYPCGTCGAGTGIGQVFVTAQGSSYHSRLNCPALRRTIYTVPLSQTGGRGRCSKCG